MIKFIKAAALSAMYFFIYFIFQIVFMLAFVLSDSVVSGMIGTPITPENMELFIYENLSYIIAFSILAALGAYLIIFRIRKRRLLKEIGLKGLGPKPILYLLLLSFATSLLSGILVSELLPSFPSYNEVSESISSTTGSLFGVIVTTIMVPIFEEILFRGLIYREFKKIMPFIPALILQGLIFGIAHGNMLQFIYAFLLGLILGYVYHYFKSIWAPILVHCAFNLLGSIVLPNYLSTNRILFFGYFIVSILITAFCLIKLRKLAASDKASISENEFDVENSI